MGTGCDEVVLVLAERYESRRGGQGRGADVYDEMIATIVWLDRMGR